MEQTQEKKKKKGKILKWILLILLLLILSAIAVVGIYAYSKFSKLGADIESENEKFEEEEIIINDFKEDEVGVGFTNFVLFGADSRDNDVESDLNTDSIIVVCLNNKTKEIKLLSVYRDTLLDMTNGSIQKCNSAYRRGGAKQAINMLNMNLDLDIQKYVTVNFSVVSDVIDMLGGIEVDVSEAEMKAVNKYLKETAKVADKKAVFLTEAGVQTLDGVQATTYARIRKGVGNDYARTERQREIITLALQKAVKADLGTINKMIDTVFPQVATNLTLTDVLKYAASLTKYKIVESAGFPFDKGDGTVSGKGSCVYPITLESNVTKLHEFLYDTANYQPSDKVSSISQEINALVNGSSSSDSKDNDDTSDEKDDSKENAGNNTSSEDDTSTDKNPPTEDDSSTGDSTTEDGTSTENDGSTEDGTSTENDGSTGDGTSTENDGSTEDGTSTENNGSTGDGTSTENDGSADDGSSTENNGSTSDGSSAEDDTSTGNDTSTENDSSASSEDTSTGNITTNDESIPEEDTTLNDTTPEGTDTSDDTSSTEGDSSTESDLSAVGEDPSTTNENSADETTVSVDDTSTVSDGTSTTED